MSHALASDLSQAWSRFLEFAKKRGSSATSFENWLAPIRFLEGSENEVTLEVPNVFVQEYLLNNYSEDLCAFLPVKGPGIPSLKFVVAKPIKEPSTTPKTPPIQEITHNRHIPKLSPTYTFDTYIEGPSNQFVKSAAMGVAQRPGQSYNPLFIHGGVGLGKTHLLHSIGHYLSKNHPRLNIQCITTEAFINDLVENLRNKSLAKWKQFYRNTIDVLLVDDIQFLQDRPNFEEEFCNTFETMIHQNKQVVVASDKPPSQLKLSERVTARMEWGLVASVGIPELETRVAIIQAKSEQKGIKISNDVAFFMAECIFSNVRQLEGAINRLSAQCRLLGMEITQEVVEMTLAEMLQYAPRHKINVEDILKAAAAIFQVKISDLKGTSRTKEITLPRQVSMYLAKELITTDSLTTLGNYFGKTHSTILHAHKCIAKQIPVNETLSRQVEMIKRQVIHK
jgi:chromosomal replication initiator protein